MKLRPILAVLLLASAAFGQAVFSGVVSNGVGQPIAGSSVAITNVNPCSPTTLCSNGLAGGTYTGVTPPGSLITLYKDLSLTTTVTNPLSSDGFGNWYVFGNAGQNLFAVIYGSGITATVLPFTLGGGGGVASIANPFVTPGPIQAGGSVTAGGSQPYGYFFLNDAANGSNCLGASTTNLVFLCHYNGALLKFYNGSQVGTMLDTSSIGSSNGIAGLDANGHLTIAQDVVVYGADSGIANAYVLAPTSVLITLVKGTTVDFIAANSNSGASTANVSSLGATAITKAGTTALASGDILAGAYYTIKYDGTEWQLLNPSTSSGGGGTGTVNTATAGQIAYYATSGTAVSGSGALLLGATGIDVKIVSGANGNDLIRGIRFTDTSPSGNYLNFLNAALVSQFKIDINGLLYLNRGTLSAPVLQWTDVGIYSSGTKKIDFTDLAASKVEFDLNNAIFRIGSGWFSCWSSTASGTGNCDTGLSRNAAGIVSVDTTTLGNGLGALKAKNLTLTNGTTATLGVGALAAGTCAAPVLVAVTGATTTSVVLWDYASDPAAVTGYGSSGGLTIKPFATSGNANFEVCNPTSGSITPGAMNLNFRVVF